MRSNAPSSIGPAGIARHHSSGVTTAPACSNAAKAPANGVADPVSAGSNAAPRDNGG